MKILHAAETLKGGPATIIRQLVKAQMDEGHDVHVVAPASHLEELGDAAALRRHAFVRHSRGAAELIRFTLRFVAAVLEARPEVVHLHGSFAGALCRPMLVLLRPFVSAKVVYQPHCWPFIAVETRLAKRSAGEIEKALSRVTDVTICGSTFEKAAAKPYSMKCQLTVIDNGVESPLPLPQSSPPPSDGRVSVLFVGRFDHQKGFDLFLEAAQRLGPEHYRFRAVGAFVRDTGRLPDVGHVEYVPWQDRPGLAEIYRSATVLVMPSRWESFGLVAVEAMSYGLPVIASDCCSLPEIVRPGVNGWLFRTGDAEDLVRTLQALSWTDYAHASAACLDTYLSMYTSNSMTDNCAGLYRSIAMPPSNTSTVEAERIDLSV